MNSSITTTPSASLSPAPAALQPPAELLTPVQLAGMLGISRRTLCNWVRDKTVPMIKVRGFCRFEYAKVRAALEQHEQPAGGRPPSPSSTL
jgi:excisionase family DNA binding protein